MKKNGQFVYGSSTVMIILSTVLAPPIYASKSAKESLVESNASFDKGQYKKALQQLENVDIRSDFDNSDDMKLAYKIRAIAYAETGYQTEASFQIRDLFFLDPAYKFDPFDTPTSVIELADHEHTLIEEKNKYLASIKSEALPQKKKADERDHNQEGKVILIEKKLPAFTTLFPFGINHFLQNSPVKGSVYLSIEALSLGVNIAAFWWKESYLDGFGSSRLTDGAQKKPFKTAQMIQYIGLGALLISYCASIIDALIRLESRESQKISSSEITS